MVKHANQKNVSITFSDGQLASQTMKLIVFLQVAHFCADA
ncbi:hypothetical protein HMPREF0556_12079 [Listeria grayi DSM 20601]|uniref:Uncharacterized protein n=1 Tax=Listeria grayi DSM 20601 TaxID=525367 RepID=D7UYH7_LISGR|nr:hypothetical protein HMPREF0556_12079 [Listeria grayi DSM 20601]